MLSGYVKSSYLNIPAASKNAELTLVELNEGTNFRLLGIQFTPTTAFGEFLFGVILRSSLGGDIFFQDEIFTGAGNGSASYAHNIASIPIPTHGVFASKTSGVTVEGTGEGIAFVSITYQAG